VLRYEHTWPATVNHIRDARASVGELAARAGAPREIVDDVRLAVSEAVANVVMHGYRTRAAGPVTVMAEAEDRRLRVEVADEGCGPSPRADSPGAGLGLQLIAEVAESMSVSRGRDGHGTVLRMTFGLPFAAAA
jgi:serine/threonine-protein kinase RsbW